jgi:DNA repair exonuclease SbcCD nuclease subunit
MRILFSSDWHLGERPPLARGPSYPEDIFAKLAEVREIAGTADLSILGGDLLHWPHANAISHRLVRRLIEFLRSWPTDLLTIVGQHDLGPEGLDSIGRQPIGVVLEALRDGPLRWLSEDVVVDVGGLKLQLSPANWQPGMEDHPEWLGLARDPRADFAVKVAHSMVMRGEGGWPFPAVAMSQVPPGADVCLIGDTHWRTGVHQVNGCWFAGPGSVARTSRSVGEMERWPAVLVVTLEKGKEPAFEEIPLKSARPGKEVFAWSENLRALENSELFAGYVTALETGLSLENLSLDEILRSLEEKADPEVVKLAREYLAQSVGGPSS